jgi:hypothetical protein
MQNILKMTLTRPNCTKDSKEEAIKQEGREGWTKKIGPSSLLLPTLLILKIHRYFFTCHTEQASPHPLSSDISLQSFLNRNRYRIIFQHWQIVSCFPN